jgi:hypothetical protein
MALERILRPNRPYFFASRYLWTSTPFAELFAAWLILAQSCPCLAGLKESTVWGGRQAGVARAWAPLASQRLRSAARPRPLAPRGPPPAAHAPPRPGAPRGGGAGDTVGRRARCPSSRSGTSENFCRIVGGFNSAMARCISAWVAGVQKYQMPA